MSDIHLHVRRWWSRMRWWSPLRPWSPIAIWWGRSLFLTAFSGSCPISIALWGWQLQDFKRRLASVWGKWKQGKGMVLRPQGKRKPLPSSCFEKLECLVNYNSSPLTIRGRGRSSGDLALIMWGCFFDLSLVEGFWLQTCLGGRLCSFQNSRFEGVSVGLGLGSTCWGQSSFVGV